jgi:hypothetical protein
MEFMYLNTNRVSLQTLPEGMFKEVMKDLWLARISSLSNEVGNFKIIMDAVEDYARRWIKRDVDQDPELESLSDWVRTIRSLVQGRIRKLKNCVIQYK